MSELHRNNDHQEGVQAMVRDRRGPQVILENSSSSRGKPRVGSINLRTLDQKSGSSLREVNVRVDVPRQSQQQCFSTLKKSRETLRHLYVKASSNNIGPGFDCLADHPGLETLIVFYWNSSCSVILKDSDTSSIQDEDASPLKVLWYDSDGIILRMNSSRFRNLVSLDAGDKLTSSQWRQFLEGPSQTLKHLRIGFNDPDEENHDGIPHLDFPILEVLELDSGGSYPQWIMIKASVKLICHSQVSNLPSVSELWITEVQDEFDIASCCPELKTIRVFDSDDTSDDLSPLLRTLDQRFEQVKAGIKVNGIQMENVKTVIVPFHFLETESVEKLRNLVEVVDGGSLPQFLEVEI